MSYLNFVKHTFYSKLAALFIGVTSHVLCTQSMGPHKYGVAVLILVFQPILIKLMNLGIAGSTTYYINKYPNNKSKYIGTLLNFGFILTIPVIFILFYFFNYLLSIYPILIYYKNQLFYVFLLTPIFILQLILKNLLKALNQIDTFNNINVLFVSIFNFVSFIFLYLFYEINLNMFLLVQISSLSISCFIILIKLYKQKNIFYKFYFSSFKEMLSYGIKGYFANISGSLNEKIETLMIGLLLSPSMIANYSVALTISNKFKIVPQSLSLPLFPHIAKQDKKLAIMSVNKLIRLVLLPLSFLILLSVYPAKYFIEYFYPKYLNSYYPFVILTLNIIFITIFKILGNYFLGTGRPELRSMQKVIFLILNIIGMLYLIPIEQKWYGGINGCAISILLSGIFVSLFSIFTYLKISKANLKDLIFNFEEFIIYFNKNLLKRR